MAEYTKWDFNWADIFVQAGDHTYERKAIDFRDYLREHVRVTILERVPNLKEVLKTYSSDCLSESIIKFSKDYFDNVIKSDHEYWEMWAKQMSLESFRIERATLMPNYILPSLESDWDDNFSIKDLTEKYWWWDSFDSIKNRDDIRKLFVILYHKILMEKSNDWWKKFHRTLIEQVVRDIVYEKR
jgi:hypothetical protein